MNVLAAVAQTDARVGALPENIERHVELAEQALSRGAGLIVFPELSLTGYSLKDLVHEVALDPVHDTRLEPLRRISKKISIVCGFVENGSDGGVYNAAACLEDGEVRHIHRKLYPPTYGMFEEGRYFSPGRTISAFDSRHGRFGMLICEDLWHVSLPYLLALDGAQALMVLTASPTRLTGKDEEPGVVRINYEQHRVYARLLGLYVIFSNRVGFEDGVNFWGGSSITDPSGEQAVRARLFEEDLVVGPLDDEEIRRARRTSRHFLDEQPDLVLKTLLRLNHLEHLPKATE